MQRAISGFLAAMILGVALTTPVASTPNTASEPGIQTPEKGDPERKAILDALRVAYPQKVVFLIHYLKVSGDWAWARVTPTVDGKSAYEDESALVRRLRGKWTRVVAVNESGECDDNPVCRDEGQTGVCGFDSVCSDRGRERLYATLKAKYTELPLSIVEGYKVGSPGVAANDVSGKDVQREGKLREVTVNTPGDGFLALRSEPSSQRGIRVLKIPHGSELKLDGCVAASGGHNWCQTTYDGRSGWIHDRYVVASDASRRGPADTEARGKTPDLEGDDIHSIDFGNFVYPLTGECAEMLKRKSVTVHNGMFELDPFTSFNVADSGQVVYGDLTGDGRDEAVVLTHCGGMHQTTEPYVYAIKDGKPLLLARLEAGSRAFGGYQDVRIEKSLLITERFEGKAACCPEFVVRATLKWDGRGFVQVGETTRVKHK